MLRNSPPARLNFTCPEKDWAVGAEKIRWQDSFDAAGARRFHELGGTEALMRLGYESDEAWWRQF